MKMRLQSRHLQPTGPPKKGKGLVFLVAGLANSDLAIVPVTPMLTALSAGRPAAID